MCVCVCVKERVVKTTQGSTSSPTKGQETHPSFHYLYQRFIDTQRKLEIREGEGTSSTKNAGEGGERERERPDLFWRLD